MDEYIDRRFIGALKQKGINDLTPVQKLAIPCLTLINETRSLGANLTFIESETGAGKTYAFLIPALSAVRAEPRGPQILIVLPTKELASQIKSVCDDLCRLAELPYKTALLVGEASIKRQIERLKEKPVIIAGTPGRINELLRLKKLDLSAVKTAVFDEADRLFASELEPETGALANKLNAPSYVFSSATLPNRARKTIEAFFSRKKIEGGLKINELTAPAENVLRERITHWAFYAEQREKIEELRKFIRAVEPRKMLVFIANANQTKRAADALTNKKIQGAASLYAGMSKLERKQAIDNFRNGKIKILVASDLAARGLDIPGITHIAQLDVPADERYFVHRAGRTARAGATGINAVFGTERELFRLSAIEKRLGIIVYPKVIFNGAVLAPKN